MQVSPSVASVTVAYNAEERLPRHFESLLGQTRPLQEIIVVDNASTDRTASLLAERFPHITVLRMSENLGMAGGWAAGLSYAALEKGHDWVWSFDNDSVPQEDTLKTLLEGKRSLNEMQAEVGILAPLPIHRKTGMCYPPYLWRDGFVKASSEVLQQRVWFADFVITSGCMVRRDVVEKIGLPRGDFFMDFVDIEYCLRARSHGYKIAFVNNAQLGHEIGNSRMVRLGRFSRMWINEPPWRNYYYARNLTYIGWWIYPEFKIKKFVLKYLMKVAGGTLLFSSRKLACLMKMAQGLLDGYRGRLGPRFRPD
jgi:GT2 family glycosyltransferase